MTEGGRFRHPLDGLTSILHLDAEGEAVAALGQAIRRNLLPWSSIFALAEAQFLVPALWPALLAKGLVEPIPEAMRRFLGERFGAAGGARSLFTALEDRHRQNAARNAAIRRQALQAIAALNAVGIEPVAIKGVRLLLGRNDRFVEGRLLRDIDFVVPGDAGGRVAAALQSIGYIGDAAATARSPHGQSFHCPRDPASLDLHVEPLSLHEPAPLPAWLTARGLWERAVPQGREGPRFRLLPPGESLIHAILHTEVADLNHAAGDWALRYLYETAVLTREAAIDGSLLGSLGGPALRRPVEAHLLAAARLFGAVAPPGVGGSPRARIHYLRCRLNARHPRYVRRATFLAYKLRQAMAEWYLRRKGFLGDGRSGLWRARLRALRALLGHHRKALPRLLLGGDDDPLPPPRV